MGCYANIPNDRRKEVYRRDGWACILCGSGQYLQIHHVIPRGRGGSDFPENLVTLCSICHGQVHGTIPLHPVGYDEATGTLARDDLSAPVDVLSPEDLEQLIVEYVSDYYAGDWYPFK